jgi:ABC-type cobalamin/Fe3+-siderophores transport system ATPase subunit
MTTKQQQLLPKRSNGMSVSTVVKIYGTTTIETFNNNNNNNNNNIDNNNNNNNIDNLDDEEEMQIDGGQQQMMMIGTHHGDGPQRQGRHQNPANLYRTAMN